MDTGLLLFGIFFVIVIILFAGIYISKPSFFHLALHNFTSRRRSAALAISGLLIGSTIISGSLILGDSMNFMVREITLENLGELDITVNSINYFDYELYEALSADQYLENLTDKISPAISLYGSAYKVEGQKILPKIRVVGFDEHSREFGDFKIKGSGPPIDYAVGAEPEGQGVPQVILNDLAASELSVVEGDTIDLQIVRPDYSMDTIFLQEFNASSRVDLTVEVTHVVYREGFARLQNAGRTDFRSTVYLNLGFLQDMLGVGNKINVVFISNEGDEEEGIKNDDAVAERVGELLDAHIGASDINLDLQPNRKLDYIKYSSSNIFFPQYHEEFLEDVDQVDHILGYSQALSYFVNYLQSESGEKVWYSTVTGIDPQAEGQYQKFKNYETKEMIDADISDDEIIINNWTAEVMGVEVGDRIDVNYMVLNRVFEPHNITVSFTVKYIIELDGKGTDRFLMPDFPGIDQDLDLEPGDWDSLFYVNSTQADELLGSFEDKYWTVYRGTPKAFISIERAMTLWRNDFGDLTSFRIYFDPANLSGFNPTTQIINDISAVLDENIGYEDAGITINKVKQDAFDSAAAMEIFPQMFLAFGMIIIAAGAIFVVNIMVTMIYNRRRELGILRALGSRRRTVISLLTLEGVFYAVIASMLGTIFGIGVAFGLAVGLNNIWDNIVEGLDVPFYFSTLSLFWGFLGGFVIGIIAIFIASWRMSKQPIVSSLRSAEAVERVGHTWGAMEKLKQRTYRNIALGLLFMIAGAGTGAGYFIQPELFLDEGKFIVFLILPFLILFGLYIIIKSLLRFKHKDANRKGNYKIEIVFGLIIAIYTMAYSFAAFRSPDMANLSSTFGIAMFFISGLLVLSGLLMASTGALLIVSERESRSEVNAGGTDKGPGMRNLNILIIRNITRNKFRSISTIIMFSLIVFLIFSLATNIMLQSSGQERTMELAGGGYDLYGESTIPVNFDLGDQRSRQKQGLTGDVFSTLQIIPLKSVGHEVGKCSNMNVVYPPKIFGVDDEFTSDNDFTFMRMRSDLDSPDEVWSELAGTGTASSEPIPIVGDYETLVWIYHGTIGTIFDITDDYGKEYELEVIAYIDSPVFAGSFIMSEQNFDTLFPTSGELRSFLFRTTGNIDEVGSDLEWEMRSLGFSVSSMEEISGETIEYYNAYMSLFQMYLYFGLFVGIAALGILSLKTTHERKYEIGVMKAIGFRSRTIFSSFIFENTVICTIGIFIGAASGMILAFLSYPFWGLAEFQFDPGMIILLAGVTISVILITVGLTFYPAYRASKLTSADALRQLE